MIIQRRTSSRQLRVALAAWAGTQLLLFLTPLPWWAMLTALLLVNGYAYCLWKGIVVHAPGAVTALKCENGQWSVLIEQHWFEVQLVDVALFRDHFTMVGFRRGWRYTRLYFWRDSADPMSLRKLRICLRHGY